MLLKMDVHGAAASQGVGKTAALPNEIDFLDLRNVNRLLVGEFRD